MPRDTGHYIYLRYFPADNNCYWHVDNALVAASTITNWNWCQHGPGIFFGLCGGGGGGGGATAKTDAPGSGGGGGATIVGYMDLHSIDDLGRCILIELGAGGSGGSANHAGASGGNSYIYSIVKSDYPPDSWSKLATAGGGEGGSLGMSGGGSGGSISLDNATSYGGQCIAYFPAAGIGSTKGKAGGVGTTTGSSGN